MKLFIAFNLISVVATANLPTKTTSGPTPTSTSNPLQTSLTLYLPSAYHDVKIVTTLAKFEGSSMIEIVARSMTGFYVWDETTIGWRLAGGDVESRGCDFVSYTCSGVSNAPLATPTGGGYSAWCNWIGHLTQGDPVTSPTALPINSKDMDFFGMTTEDVMAITLAIPS